MEFVDIAATAAVVVGLVEAIKKTKLIDKRGYPVIAVAFGISLGLLVAGLNGETFLQGIWNGLLAGLIAAGTYDVAVKTVRA